MRISPINFRSLESQTLFISLLIHLTLAQFFILTLRSTNNEFKPTFTFLGAILAENDFQNLTLKETSLRNQKMPVIKVKSTQSSHESARVVSKPIAAPDGSSEQKVFLKSSFIQAATDVADKNDIKNLGIETTAPKRMPLKLDLK